MHPENSREGMSDSPGVTVSVIIMVTFTILLGFIILL